LTQKVYGAAGDYLNTKVKEVDPDDYFSNSKKWETKQEFASRRAKEKEKERGSNSRLKPIEPKTPSKPNPQPPIGDKPKVSSPKTKKVRLQTSGEAGALSSRYFPNFGKRKKKYRRGNKVFVS
jgi:hypothetical protein